MKNKSILKRVAKGLASASLYLLVGCDRSSKYEDWPRPGDSFTLDAKVVDTQNTVNSEMEERHLLLESGNQLYHTSYFLPKEYDIFDQIEKQDRIKIHGRHEGRDKLAEFLFDVDNDRVIYLTNEGLVVLGTPQAELNRMKRHSKYLTSFGDFIWDKQEELWTYKVKKQDNPRRIADLFNEQDRIDSKAPISKHDLSNRLTVDSSGHIYRKVGEEKYQAITDLTVLRSGEVVYVNPLIDTTYINPSIDITKE